MARPSALQTQKPARWNVAPGLVDPRFRGLWNGLVKAIVPYEGVAFDLVNRVKFAGNAIIDRDRKSVV